MIQTGIESRVKIQDVISSQLPNFILEESPKTVDFLKQYYISQEFQSGVVDIAENLDQYLDFDNLSPEKLSNDTTLSVDIGIDEVNTVTVSSTKGFPNKYGLLKIDNEILTYTGITSNTFTGLTRGFSGITSYHAELNEEELVFTESNASVHVAGSSIQNLSSLFLNEFYKKIKYTFAPGFENLNFDKSLNIGNFLKEIKSFYETKGTDDAIKILFRVLYGVDPKILNLEDLLFKPSAAEYLRRETVIVEVLSGNPIGLVGQTIKKIEKLNDPTTQASVSEVEPFTRQGKQYFKFSLFIGYSGASLVEGNFKITPSSKSIENISIGSSVITVDSTIGFPSSGKVLSGINTISYSDKTVNQFLGCTGIESAISISDSVFSDEIYFGYEDGDVTKKVEFRITGILSKFNQKSENAIISEGDVITIKNLGDKVLNPTIKNNKEIFANSWIYNTSSFIGIDEYDGSGTFTLKKKIDRSIFKKGDKVEFVNQSRPDEIIYPSANDTQPFVEDILSDTIIKISGLPDGGFKGTTLKSVRTNSNLRKKLNKAVSNDVSLKYDNITSDVTNVYFDDDSGYAASNSLPSAKNSSTPDAAFFEDIDLSLNKVKFNTFTDLNLSTGKFKTIQIEEQGNNIKLITGDKVFYESSGPTFNSIGVGATAQSVGIDTGAYFIEIVDPNASTVKLYSSRSFIPSGTALELDFPKDNEGNIIEAEHTFTLYSQRSNIISPSKSFKKFPLNPSLKDGGVNVTIPGSIGKMINGVEIFNYKTNDKIYFGPISDLNVLSGGSGYDVINPPKIEISEGVGTGATSVVCVKGKVVDAFIDPQDFDIDRVVSIGITGGNGSGAVIEPIIGKRSREIVFDAIPFTTLNGFGVDSSERTLTFRTRHNLNSGDRVIYSSNRQVSIGETVGDFISNNEYFVSIVNDKTVRFYKSQKEAAAAIDGRNAIGIAVTSGGIQRLIVGSVNNTILGVNVLSGGEGYENRKLSVQPSNISTIFNKIKFENHNFKDGDKILYEHVGTTITGLSTTPNQQYIVTKVDDDSFKLSDAGIGGTSLINFNQKKFVNFESTGIGTQTFKYPDIVATVEYLGIGTFGSEKVIANITPVVKGEISDIYLLEKGSGYGSSILNFENSPIVKIKNGSDGSIPELKPVINSITGGISTVSIGNSGSKFFSTPVIEVIDSLGIGNGAKLRVVMNEIDGELTGSVNRVEVISAGIGYSESTTSIRVTPSGVGGVISANVRSLNVNNNLKYSSPSFNRLEEHEDILKNVMCGYSREPFKDDGTNVSKIIGWAYDGNPIYGPYGYVDPEKKTNDFKLLESGYKLVDNSVIDRPIGPAFGTGFFIEDYVFDGSGDLDEFNGRYEINDDYPNGVYAYHATGIITSGSFAPAFPYFIGNKYRSKFEKDNLIINQSFDFSNSSLRRNTFPYNVTENDAGNDFITEANSLETQKIEIETVESGSINKIQIIEDGTNQKVGDILNFDNTGTGGDGLIAKVESIKGVSISSITSNTLTYNQSTITKEDNDNIRITTPSFHNLVDRDLVVISGLTSSLSHVNGSYVIGVSSIVSSAISPIISNAGAATTEIYSDIARFVKVGDKIRAGIETLTVLNTYDQPNIITVERGDTGLAHTATTPLYIVPDSFTIKKSVDNIDSNVNQKVFYNPVKSVGFGTTAGQSKSTEFSFGETRITRTIPTKGIYLENHPFVTNQKLTVKNGGNPIGYSDTPDGTITSMPSTVFVVNKNKNVIGIKTIIGGSEVFFHDQISGSAVEDKDTYSFETNFNQEKVSVKNIKNTVSLGSSSHQLNDGDLIKINVISNTSVGIGTLSEVVVKRDVLKDSILVDSVTCPTSGITTSLPPVGFQTGANIITLENHNFTTGQKINLVSTNIPVGLGNSDYFVSVVDDRTFNLCDSFENATANPPIVVAITSTTGSGIHTFSKINPKIFVEKNNNLVFDTSDSSLTGYKFKIYYDKEFRNEFVSTGSSQGFNTPVGIITEGEANSKFTINYESKIPDRLYYNIEKLGVAVTADNTVKNYSEIEFVKNNYNGTFKISNVGVQTFTFNSDDEPLRTITNKLNTVELSYSTTSENVTGSINSVKIVSGGSNYKKLPTFVSVGTTSVVDVNVLAKSNSVGNIRNVRVINEGFEYPSDPTLQPEALLPKFIQLRGSKSISSVEVIDGGANYITPPELIVIDTETGAPFDDGLITATLSSPTTSGSSLLGVDIEKSPTGISVGNVAIAATSNTNGVSIQKVNSSANTSTFDVFITTPAFGYVNNPFEVGDSVFIEGLKKVGVAGSGFNSSDYGYKFLSVVGVDTTGTLDKITIDVSEYTTNTGVAVTSVGGFADIINSNVYPKFKLNLQEAGFTIGEKIIIDDIERDLTVVESGENFVKLQGLDNLNEGDILIGSISRNKAKTTNVFINQGQFEVNYSLIKDLGWENNVGKLNEDIQVLPNNDYYQNLSYSIQSPIEWNDLKSPVNNLVHTSGFKNFSDTGISSSSSAFPIRGSAKVTTFLDVLPTFAETVRVDTIYNFDGARDIFVGTGSTDLNLDKTKSKFIELEKVKLTDFIISKSNNVLNIDDISSRYSNLNSDPNSFLDIIQVQPSDGFNRVLTLIKNPDNTQTQIAELIILNNNSGSYLLERSKLSSESDFTKFELVNEFGRDSLRFTPSDAFKFDVDYDIKQIESKFNTTLTGIGTNSFGFADITGSVANVGVGTTSSIISTFASDSLFIKTQVTDTVTNDMNYVEHLVGRDATNTYFTESYFDSNQGTFSSNFLATFSPSLSGIGNSILSFNVTNTRSNPIRVRSSIVGFGTTSAGIGTYRFLAPLQEDNSERTQLVESKFDEKTGISTIATLDKDKFIALKSTAHVATATSEALHQVYVTHNGTEIFTSSSEYLSIVNGVGENNANPPLGIGTFHAKFVGDNFVLQFIPDNASGITTVRSLNEVFYSDTDEKTKLGSVNYPNPVIFGKLTQSSNLNLYNALNGDRINRRNFELTNNDTPIFAKTFNPLDTSIINIGTGKTFTIKNHFFRTNEELIYTPQASFVGIGSTAMMFKHDGDSNTSPLPTSVFAIRINDDTFSISTTRGGNAVEFVDAGEGNNHQFEMAKGLSKTLITIDGLVQHPIAQTDLVYQLVGNISSASTIFRLSGISSINNEDLIKIDDEYIRVTNVGLGTNIAGPISATGSIPLIEGKRGYVGSSAASHNNSSNVTIFKGSYNIVGKEIHFSEAPRGNNSIDFDESNLPPARSDFEGRVYLRNDYSTNRVYDDISNKFTGIASTFELKSGGISTSGIGNTGGNGILFINNIFQSPSTVNNSRGNFKIVENITSGVSTTTVIFSGITTVADGDIITNDTDVNQNDLPRGGVIVSLGSSGGLGYAPLVPAIVKPQISTGGTITSIVGVAYSGASNNISTASYDNNTGVLEITTVDKHGLRIGYTDEVLLSNLEFSCAAPHAGVTTTIFPDGTIGDKFSVVSISSTNTFKTQVGPSTIPHTFVGGGTVKNWFGNLTFGSGYNTGITTNGVSVAATVFDPGYDHDFISADTNAVTANTGAQFTPSDASYDPVTGDLVLFISGTGIQTHGLTDSNTVQIATGSISFACSKDDYSTIHSYPRSTDPVAGISTAILSFNADTITVNVGANVGSGAKITTTIGVGGTLSFNIVDGGTNYKEPEIFVPSPSYSNMSIEGISRVGFGTGPETGIGALISVSGVTTTGILNFELSRSGYKFRKGDKFTPVGLVTDKSFTRAEPFTLEVTDVYQDNFSSWQFGELDYIDSIKDLQDGSRTVYPLRYNGELLSITIDDDSDIIAENLLIIFVNGVVQKPGVNYQFEGGTVLSFTTAPSVDDDVVIYVYKGTAGVDSALSTDINKTLEEGDTVQIMRSSGISTSVSQDERTVFDLTTQDRFETNVYVGQGIDEINFKPLNVYKQKNDKIINGRIVPKTRDSIATQIYPTAKVIRNITDGANNIYVDNADFFNYEDEGSPDFNVKLIPNSIVPTVGILSATISNNQVNAISIASSGSNYTTAPTISISAPPSIGVGVGTTATATVTVNNGGINAVTITNAGFGYTVAPSVLVQPPVRETEIIKVEAVSGFSATITRIRVATSGISTITFNASRTDTGNFDSLGNNDYIFVSNTTFGHSVTSLASGGVQTIGVGTTFFDNIYQVSSITRSGTNAEIKCKATVTTPDNILDTGVLPNIGTLSFGKLSSLTRSSSPITLLVKGFEVDSGLSTFPSIQRSGGDYTLRNTGALPKSP